MRIALAAIVAILGANLLIDLLDSDLVDVMNERRETIEKQMERMWQSDNLHTKWARGPKSCIV